MTRTAFPGALLLALLVVAGACGGDARGASETKGPGNAGGGGGGGGGGRGGRNGGGAGDRATPIEVAVIGRGTVSRTTTVAGVLEPIKTVGVNSQLSGPLVTVKVEEGNRVTAGQELAEIDAKEIQAQVRAAKATLELAESTARRSEELIRQKIITATEYERDRAALASSRESHEQLETRLGYASIRAPISGVITEKRVEAGDVVSTQARLFSIADVSTLVSRVQVSERDVPALSTSTVVDVSVDALGGGRMPGRIRRIFPAADSATRLVPVEVALTGSAITNLRPGYTIRAQFRLGERADALLVPTRAVIGPFGARSVFIVQGGKAERRAVVVGPDVDGNSEVLDGLAVGDSVVVAGNALLREGGAIRIVPPLAPLETGPDGRPVGNAPAPRQPSSPGRRSE
jgi:membrane fusion protein, multidrug efflux system